MSADKLRPDYGETDEKGTTIKRKTLSGKEMLKKQRDGEYQV